MLVRSQLVILVVILLQFCACQRPWPWSWQIFRERWVQRHRPDQIVRMCDMRVYQDNVLLINPNYPQPWNGGTFCSYTIHRRRKHICQLRIDFQMFSMAQPDGDGNCVRDSFNVESGNTSVPTICGENRGQHVYVTFMNDFPITIRIATGQFVNYNRRWEILISQIKCHSPILAPSGCLQYYTNSSAYIQSFNYGSGENPSLNSLGIMGSRQLANLNYNICIKKLSCGVTFSIPSTDIYAFTLTNDVFSVPTSQLGTSALMQTTCTTDYILITSPFTVVNGVRTALTTNRFCGLGIASIYSTTTTVQVVTDGNETPDIANRGFYFIFVQGC